jgi:hypothetical protein
MAANNRSQQYIPITDFFNTHAWFQQLSLCRPRNIIFDG